MPGSEQERAICLQELESFQDPEVVVHCISQQSKLLRKSGIRLLGAVPQMPSKHAWLKFTEWAQEFGPIHRVKLGADNLVILSVPKIIEDLIVKRQHIYSSRHDIAAIPHENRTSMQYLPLMANSRKCLFVP